MQASYFLKKAAKLNKASNNPGKEVVGKVTLAQVQEIADLKMIDLNAISLEGAINIVKGSAVSRGMEVIN